MIAPGNKIVLYQPCDLKQNAPPNLLDPSCDLGQYASFLIGIWTCRERNECRLANVMLLQVLTELHRIIRLQQPPQAPPRRQQQVPPQGQPQAPHTQGQRLPSPPQAQWPQLPVQSLLLNLSIEEDR